MSPEKLPHVVIVGCGFSGLAAAHALRRANARVTIVDQHNYHLFQPLLYQVATAALNPADIASPIRRVFRNQRNVEVMLGEVLSIDAANRKLILSDTDLPYDYLIVATGATHSYFGHEQWMEPAPGLKTIENAIEIRRRVLVAYEAAERESDRAVRRDWLTFVIVGGGPTGVELAGALAEIARRVLARDFRRIVSSQARIVLVEGASRLLPAMSPQASESARRHLERLGVEIILNAMVTGVDDNGVDYQDSRIAARTVIWAAGVAASPLGRSLGAPLDRAGRVLVNPDLSVPNCPGVFVVGDLAALTSDGRPVPGLAPAAMQEGRHVARNILRALRDEALEPFHYVDKGVLATIGRGAAVADIGRLHLRGFIAWIMWLTIHVFYLIGFRNRFFVLAEWAAAYLRNDRGARLITGDVKPLLERGRRAAPAK